jgi:hypothetical protein
MKANIQSKLENKPLEIPTDKWDNRQVKIRFYCPVMNKTVLDIRCRFCGYCPLETPPNWERGATWGEKHRDKL